MKEADLGRNHAILQYAADPQTPGWLRVVAAAGALVGAGCAGSIALATVDAAFGVFDAFGFGSGWRDLFRSIVFAFGGLALLICGGLVALGKSTKTDVAGYSMLAITLLEVFETVEYMMKIDQAYSYASTTSWILQSAPPSLLLGALLVGPMRRHLGSGV
ncbi:MAG: hypothetical protein AAF561_08245 [Planctomycetota bacterium]